MILVEYKLHKISKNAKQSPHFIMDGGYHVSPLDKTMVGLVEDEADRDYYIRIIWGDNRAFPSTNTGDL